MLTREESAPKTAGVPPQPQCSRQLHATLLAAAPTAAQVVGRRNGSVRDLLSMCRAAGLLLRQLSRLVVFGQV